MIEMSTLLIDGVIARASERLGYSALRPNQYKAIKSFLEGKDVFVTLSGKSLCYAIFAFDDMYRVSTKERNLSNVIPVQKHCVLSWTPGIDT